MTDGRLMSVSRDMNVTADLDNALKRNLTALDKELKDFNKTFQPVHTDLENYLTAFAGKVLFFISGKVLVVLVEKKYKI